MKTKTVTTRTGNRRLLKLADFLEGVPRARFDYTRWVGADWQGARDLSCGTKACALGWATTMPTFQRLGLILRRRFVRDWPKSLKMPAEVALKGSRVADAFEVASRIFGVTCTEAKFLFSPGDDLYDSRPRYDATPKQVAKHIRKFVAGRA